MRGDAIERLSADDLVSFAEDCGAVPLHVGLIALLAPGPPLTPEQALRALEERLPGVPRLRRRLVRPPGWLGRPLWCDDPGFDVGRHVTVLERAGGLAEVLAVADDLITRPLDWRHPLCGEPRDAIVFSMLVSTRTPAAAAVGNGSGLVQVAVPTAGPPGERLAAVAGRTAVAKRQDRAAANTLLGAAVRVLGGLHLFHAFSVRQRLVHTFETTLRVPGEPLVLLGRPVVGLIAQPVVNGNLTVVSASVEYLGRLTVTLMADPDACPDLDALRDRLAAVLEAPSGRYGAKTEA